MTSRIGLALLLGCTCLLLPTTPARAQAGIGPEILEQVQFVQTFIGDYNAFDPVRLGKWLSAKRGVIAERELQPKEGFLASYSESAPILKQQKVTFGLQTGQFMGPHFYRGLFQQTGGDLGDLPEALRFICGFEQIGGQWYLTQTHRFTQSSADWLMVGDSVAAFGLSSATAGGRRFSLETSTGQDRAVLLAFFDKGKDVFSDINDHHLAAVKAWYGKFKASPIYILNVSEYDAETTEAYLAAKKLPMPVLLDPESRWHHMMDIDVHPYLLLIDHEGIVRALHRPATVFDKAAYDLFGSIVTDVVAEAPPVKKTGNSPSPPVDPTAKF